MTWFEVVFLSVLEGLTEFLPVSSTGHLIVLSSFFGIEKNEFVKNFNIIIQSGAILAVLLIYWRRFLPNFKTYKHLLIAFLPAAIIGFAVKKKIDLLLESPEVVAVAFILGGIMLLWVEKHQPTNPERSKTLDQLEDRNFVKIGIWQCLAFIPGVSRSAATIVGGLFQGLSRKEAAEFSFFLAVPTLMAAGLYKGYSAAKTVTQDQVIYLLVGSLIAFVVAIAAIRLFIALVTRMGFRPFAYYRIVVGIIVLVFCFLR